MKYALTILLLIATFILSPTVHTLAQSPIQVEAPLFVGPGEEMTIRADIIGNATNVTLSYSICTASLCGYPSIIPMENNGTQYEAVLPPQGIGYFVKYQITAMIDGVQETSEEMTIDVSTNEETSPREAELYLGLAISGTIIAVTLAFVFLYKRRGGEKDEME